MLSLPEHIMIIFHPFSQLFSKRVWPHTLQLWIGAILCRKQHTVSAILRVLGLSKATDFAKYHRVLNKNKWSPLAASRLLLDSLIGHLHNTRPLFIGIDDTLERRFGKRISFKGLYHDTSRSIPERKAYSIGLQWLSMMFICPLPFSKRRWALPFMTVLAPSKRSNERAGKRHKTIIDWSTQMVLQVHRWLSDKSVYLLADGAFAGVGFAQTCRRCNWHLVCRLRLDARLYDFAPSHWRKPGRKPNKGARLTSLKERSEDPSICWQPLTINWYQKGHRTISCQSGTCLWYRSGLQPIAIRWVMTRDLRRDKRAEVFFSTDVDLSPQTLIEYYFQRWNVEVTFEEARQHLGFNTQRQWADKAIKRATPALLALYSMIAITGNNLSKQQNITPNNTAWYHKSELTFSDLLTYIRMQIWMHSYFKTSDNYPDLLNYHINLNQMLINQLARAA